MKNLSLKLDDTIFQNVESIAKEMKLSRNRYINQAVNYFNILQKRKLLAKQLAYESNLVSKESQLVMEEMEMLEDDFETI